MQEPQQDDVQEVHAAVSPQGCKALEKRFKQMELKIRLVEVINTGVGDLPYDCIFEGPDANPEAERFTPKQYKDS